MDPAIIVQLVVLVILIALSAFFSSAETAFVTVSQIKMRTLAESGNKKAERVLKITSNSAKLYFVRHWYTIERELFRVLPTIVENLLNHIAQALCRQQILCHQH